MDRLVFTPEMKGSMIPWALGAVLTSAILHWLGVVPFLKFAWHCFIQPIGSGDQKTRLDKFYQGQAAIYDSTRDKLLRGRRTILSLAAAHLQTMGDGDRKERLVWVDIGGGTGLNLELMDRHFPISSFSHVYIIDLCEPLLSVARKRVVDRGWTNVTVLCQDAPDFVLPEWSNENLAKETVSLVTLSYSLSMIPSFYALLDRIDHVLKSDSGLLAVADFYTSGRHPSMHEKAIGGASKECGWLSRWFWQIWFDFDHVSLSPARREYLEYKFGTIKCYNGRNQLVPYVVEIPYYIWLGRPRRCDVSKFCHAFEVEGGNTIANCSPKWRSATQEPSATIPPLEIGAPMMEGGVETNANEAAIVDINLPFSSFHYGIKHPWRLPFYEQSVHKEFRTFVYSFTWEDPVEDMKHLGLTRDDSVLVITSAGDNALHYAIKGQVSRIHCVDMNPCQGHLLELKLAALESLDYDEFFSLFGRGQHPNFRALLDTKLSPLLSSAAYQFWRYNTNAFSPRSSFYTKGYSGWALRLTSLVFTWAGVGGYVRQMCECDTLVDQVAIWEAKLRPVLLNPMVMALLKSPVFCWNALGVPLAQRKMIIDEGGFYNYVCDTLDPMVSTYLLKNDNYFYRLVLMGQYTPSSCPEYLTRSGYETLRNSDLLNSFRLHTDSIENVLHGLDEGALTKAVVMDHLDWFPEDSQGVRDEVDQFLRVLAPGGVVFWRSAARQPWYNRVFSDAGFTVEPVGVRQTGSNVALDRVNMYASFWKATRRA